MAYKPGSDPSRPVDDKQGVFSNEMLLDLDYQNLSKTNVIKLFNKHRKVFINDVVTGTISYMFFTKPDLNLITNAPAVLDKVKLMPEFNMVATSDPEIMYELCESNTNTGPFVKALCNMAIGCDVEDRVLKTRDIVETTTDNKMVYGQRLTESLTAGTKTITFRDDSNFTVYKTLEVWVNYINKVSSGELDPLDHKIDNAEIDYIGSVFIITCKEDGMEIINAEKIIGFPINIPDSSVIKLTETSAVTPMDTYSITWQYNHRRLGTEVIRQLANLCTPSDDYDIGYSYAQNRSTSTWSKKFWIEYSNYKYYIRWAK